VNVILDGTQLGAATNAKGEFEIRNVPPGKYKVYTQMITFKNSVAENVSVPESGTVILNFEIESYSY
jgi:hypothetical protein